VFRPADAVETAECWALALAREDGPSLLSLTRQNLPTVCAGHAENRSARGAYVLAEAEGARQATLIATGSEVEIALAAREQLKADGIDAAVVSMPCQELFDQQDLGYRQTVLGDELRLAVEAASTYGWSRYVADEADVIGMTGFGASGPYQELYQHFGITADAVAKRVKQRLG
jgi:transketolase